jgi:integrase
VCRRAGISPSTREQKGLRFHDLRRSAAAILLAAGVPERVVMEMLGHSTLANG